MKKVFVIGVMILVVTVTAIVSFRLSTDALSIIVGAVLGMAAILPTVVLVAYLLKKNQEAITNQLQTQHQPPVVVVSGGMLPQQLMQQPQQQATQQPGLLPPPSRSMPRKFHLMGYEDTDSLEFEEEEWAATA